MIAGVINFLLAASQVASSLPGSGEAVASPFLAPLFFIVVFEVLHRRQANRAMAYIDGRDASSTQTTRNQSPWPWVLAHQIGFYAVLHFGWNRYVQTDLGLADVFFAPAVLLIAPWFAVYVSALFHRWRREESRRPDPWPLPAFLLFQLRVFIVPLLPCLVFSITGWLTTFEPTRFTMAAYPSLPFAISLVFTFCIVVFSPFLIRLALASDSMPQGPLRHRFEEIARSGDFKFLDIRVARTHGRVMNAMFVGVAGRLRYVFMTDAILERLSDEDLAGVFAHEMGHSRRGHILLNMAMFLGMSLFMLITVDSDPAAASGWSAVFLYPAFIFFVFSPVAKAFESEADAYAGEILGDPAPIKKSLEKIGQMYPKRMKDGGLIHPSIEQRVGFLAAYFANPKLATEFRSRLKRIKTTIALFFLVPLLLWANTLPHEIRMGGLRAGAMEAADDKNKVEGGKSAAALMARYEDELEGDGIDPGYEIRATLWQTVALGAQESEDFPAAAPFIELMREHRDEFSSPVYVYNTSILSAYQAAATGNWPLLIREWRRAADELAPIEEMAPDDPQIERERRDMALLAAIETMARRLGALSRTAHPQDLPAATSPEFQFLHLLDRIRLTQGIDESLAADLAAARETLTPGWKRAALRQLESLVRPTNGD